MRAASTGTPAARSLVVMCAASMLLNEEGIEARFETGG
jgi:hypothetical protein